MLVIVGFFIVCGCVFGGYLMEGGHIGVLVQPIELLIIGGAALGSFVIASPAPLMKRVVKQVIGTITNKGGPTSEDYKALLLCLFEIFKLAKSNPMAIEPHVEKPENSDIFKRYPAVLHNHHATEFLCDTLKVQLTAAMSPYDLEDLMDADIHSAHEEEAQAVATMNRVGDAMPGLGIVAAVLGVVITMGNLSAGKEVIGHNVAAALVGTFLGILISYGFMQPLSAKMESNNNNEGKFLSIIKAALIAYAKNCAPKVCVEFGRRTIPPEARPSFEEVDKAASAAGKG